MHHCATGREGDEAKPMQAHDRSLQNQSHPQMSHEWEENWNKKFQPNKLDHLQRESYIGRLKCADWGRNQPQWQIDLPTHCRKVGPQACHQAGYPSTVYIQKLLNNWLDSMGECKPEREMVHSKVIQLNINTEGKFIREELQRAYSVYCRKRPGEQTSKLQAMHAVNV